MRLTIGLLFFLICFDLFGNITLGSFGQPIGRVRTEAESTENLFSLNPYIGIFYKYRFSPTWAADLELNFVLPQDSYEDMQSPKSQLKRIVFTYNANYFFTEAFFAIFGMSTIASKVTGEGGNVTVGSRSYVVPSEPESSSYNMVVNLGIGCHVISNTFAEIQTHIWRPFDSEARGMSISFALKYELLNFFGGV